MRTIKRNIPEINTNLSNFNKHFNQMDWKGIIENKNIFTVDQSSLADAKNVFVDSKQRLVSRDPLQIDNTLPEGAVPENNVLIEVYPAGELFVYVSKSSANLYTIVINNSVLSNLATYHLSIIKQYIICFNEQNAKVYDTNNPNLGWQNLTDLAEIPVTLRVSGNQRTTYPGNEFTSAHKEEYIWSENSRPDLPIGMAEVVLNTALKQYTWTISDTNILTDYRILRPLNVQLREGDLFTTAGDIICIGRSDYFLISYNGGNTFDKIWYPLHGKFLNIASISVDGDYFFFVAADAVYRCDLETKSWSGGVFYYKSNISGQYGTLLNITNENAIGYNNICHFLTSDIFTFLLYVIIDDIPTTYILYKGPNLGEINTQNFLNTINMIKIENSIEFLEERTITEKDCDKGRLKCALDINRTIASVVGIFSYNTDSQFIFAIRSQLPNTYTTILVTENIDNSIYATLKDISYISTRSLTGENLLTGGIKIDFNSFSEIESIIARFGSSMSNPFTRHIQTMAVYNNKIYCGGPAINQNIPHQFAIYDIATNTFSPLIINPFLYYIGAIAIYNNKIYCVGSTFINGQARGAFAIYDIATKTFGPLITNPFTESIDAIAIYNNKIYCGGSVVRGLGEFAIYDIATNTFSPLFDNPFTSPIRTIEVYENKAYCGGGDANLYTGEFAILDMFTNMFSSLFDNPCTNPIRTMKIYDNNIYCGGGGGGIDKGVFTIYNITTGSFGPLITNPFTYSIYSMVINEDKIYCGGFNSSGNGEFAIYDIFSNTFSLSISNPFTYSIYSMVINENKIYCGGASSNIGTSPAQFAIYSEYVLPYGWSTISLEKGIVDTGEFLDTEIGDIFFSLDNADDGYPYSLTGGWISNLTVYNSDQTLLANLPDEITTRESTWVIGDYFYIKVGNTIYTNSLTTNDNALLTYTYIPENNIFNKVPNVSYSDTELYLGFNNLLQITNNAKDGVNILFNLPVINNQSFIANITSMINISTTEVAIFFENNIVICAKVEDETFKFRYDYYNTKLSTGVRLGDSTINTLEGAFSIFPTRRGLAAMNYQAYMATTDQVLNYITVNIEELWTKFYDASSVIKIIQWRDILVIINGTKTILLYDLVNASWWKWEVPLNIRQMITNQIELKLISDDLYVFKPHSRYKDFPTKYNQTNINWSIQSQQLHMKLPNHYKNIKQLIFQLFSDNDNLLQNTIVAQIKLYRKRVTLRDPEIVAFTIDELRTFVKRFNYWKINELQWGLANDTETATPAKLQLNGVSVKYEVGEEVK